MNRWKLQSTFQKMALSFLLLGVLPLLCVCLLFLWRYEINARLSIEAAMEEANFYAQTKVSDLLGGIDRSMEALYDYADGDYAALYEILEDESLSDNERKMHIGLLLDELLHADSAVSAAYFVAPGGEVYSRFYSQNKSLRSAEGRRLAGFGSATALAVLPAASEAGWVNSSDDEVLSLARHYMDTRSPAAVSHVVLGTAYVDVHTGALDELLRSVRLGENGNAAIVDRGTGDILYRLREDADVPLPQSFPAAGGSFGSTLYTAYHQPIADSGYSLLLSFDRRDLYSAFASTRTYLFFVLAATVVFVLVLWLRFSGRMSRPARQLEKAMAEVRQGDLSVRVDIKSGDEMEALAGGFNHMVEELASTIEEVYVAEICQRNAELNALKMQVQPHYLYNTLDVIRMNALEGGDAKTARLIESLSRQLRYVMEDHHERVPLRRELESLQEYGVLLDARYEGRIRLHAEARNEDLDLLVPKLLLQPFVENAVKHGLRAKAGGGSILIEAARLEDALQIAVINDGHPIEPERLAHIRHFLATAPVGREDEAGIVSVGMKNTCDRIKLNCGEEYGFTIDSDERMGVIVTIRLPIWRDDDVEDPAGG